MSLALSPNPRISLAAAAETALERASCCSVDMLTERRLSAAASNGSVWTGFTSTEVVAAYRGGSAYPITTPQRRPSVAAAATTGQWRRTDPAMSVNRTGWLETGMVSSRPEWFSEMAPSTKEPSTTDP
jgi:hypothetical protein